MDINEIAIPFISVLHNKFILLHTTQPVIVSVVLILKFTLIPYIDLLEVFQMFRHIFIF